MNRKPSASIQHHEWTPWLLPSERERSRPFTEQNQFGRMKTREDHEDIFGDRRTARNERPPFTSYTTSYGQHYNQINTTTNSSM